MLVVEGKMKLKIVRLSGSTSLRPTSSSSAYLHHSSCIPSFFVQYSFPSRMTGGSGSASGIRVCSIWVYPIKSCRGISMESSTYTLEGLSYDRQWMIVDFKTMKACTARNFPAMVLITCRIEQDRLVVDVPFESGHETFDLPLEPTEDDLWDWET
ncbi:Uncharacterized Fe-S protein [Phaffia rhodozyma]|uniref:Uncharacterized Fe-S protein n=1 Tax=Phaffia rhodozyma TaxID=264483 RepID=A0A0F7SPQ7_PHARH|nr:Uncharacterized Fe-S protein [Phaffia rhodozyma]